MSSQLTLTHITSNSLPEPLTQACIIDFVPRPAPIPDACIISGPIKWRSTLKNTIYEVLQSKKDWQETEHETDWDFFWADKGWIHHEMDKMHLNDWQRVNHFPNHGELTRKDLLIKVGGPRMVEPSPPLELS